MRNPKGTVTVCEVRGMLRIQLPRHLFGGQQKYIYLNLPNTPLNRQAAEFKAQSIASDIAFEKFDFSLEKYQAKIQDEFDILLGDLWGKYIAYKSGHVSITTMNKDFSKVTAHIGKLPSQHLRDAKKIRRFWVATLTAGAAKKTLMQVNACCKWGVDEELIPRNPFDNLSRVKTMPNKPKINPFTRDERDKIIAAFERNCPHYAPFTKFLFWTGCRPSEAIGLQWKHIAPDLSEITFSEAVVEGNRKDTKNHTIRKFPVNDKLKALLSDIKIRQHSGLEELVFLSEKGCPVDGHNFLNRDWKTILDENAIAYRVVYNCRHTFATLCLEAGIPVTQVAQWIGNSPEVIWKYYAGLVSAHIVPE